MNLSDINPKIILTNSLTTGRRFIKKQNIEGVNVFNYVIHTPESFVKEKLIRLLPHYRLISNDECAYILLFLISNHDYGLRKYVTSFGAASKLLEVINDYRYSDNNKFTYLITADYSNLLKDYENELKNNNLIDYLFALKILKDNKQKEECLVLDDLELRPIEKSVFSSIFANLEFFISKDSPYVVKDIFKNYGQYNEAANVLDYINENKIALGDVEVLFSNSIYENIIKGLCSARKIPYTLKSNHAKSSNYISFIYDILDYFNHDYKYELLENILSNHGLDTIYLDEFYSTLNFPIYVVGFSIERSIEFINEYENDEIRKSKIPHFLEFFKDLLAIYQDGFNFSYLLEMAKKYIKALDEISALSNQVAAYENLIKLEKDDNEKINLLMNLLNRLTYNEKDNDQKISFSPINKSFTLRKHIFVLGVNQTLLLSSDVENAFINDVKQYQNELKEDKKLHISIYQRTSKVDNLKYFLAHSKAIIHLSYSSFDKIALKEMTSGVRLICEPMQEIEKNCYKEQINEVSFKNTLSINHADIIHQYNNEEINALEEKDEINHEEVLPVESTIEIDPYFKLSPSAVRSLILCPYQFYYQNILKIPNVSFPSLDEVIWLESNTRGTLFHEIMEYYFKNFINKDNVYFDQKLFNKAFYHSLKNAEKINPINNQYVYEQEKEELKEISIDYINKVLDTFNKYKVLAVEYDLKKLNYHYPKNHNLLLNGIIDRIDGYLDNNILHLRIVDYKSGKVKNKKTNDYYQHVLYSFILKEGLKNLLKENKKEFNLDYQDVIIDEFEYIFIRENAILSYESLEFDENSLDYQLVFSSIDKIVLNYLNKQINFIDLIDEMFMNKYLSFKEEGKDAHNMCTFCAYKKECKKRLEWGAKEWKETK